MMDKKEYGLMDILRIPFQCAPVAAILVAAQLLLNGLVPTLQIVVTARFIDSALIVVRDQADISLIYPSMLAVVALIAFTWISRQLAKLVQVRLELAIRERFRTALVVKRAKLAYKHIENNETWNLISRVSKTPETQMTTAYTDLLSLVAKAIRIGGILTLLFTQVWWAALVIIVISIPLFALAIKSGKATYQANREVSKHKRKYEYLSEVLTGREAVDERSMFGYSDRVNQIWSHQYETARRIEYKTEKKWFIKMKTGSVLTALLSFLIILVLLGPVLSGAMTIGMFISLVNAVFGLVQMMSWDLTSNMDQLAKHREYLIDLSSFSKLEEEEGAIAVPVAPAPVFESLEFRNVSFKYPGTDKKILDGLSLRITAGMHYAFVGINGAGKTTITKLITGLYTNYEGEIRLNGKNLSEYSQGELKAFYSVVYQDFAQYFITMKDNIAVGDVNGLPDKAANRRIQNAIDNVGLSYVEATLPQGKETPLGKIREGGQDVSGGEWQRIAMARAILNPAPLRILDEPTAALDPLSESKLYEEFEQISRDKTTLFISHRLGSTQLADEIFVIGDGRVIEQGSHTKLIGLGGVYARMYESQRSWYQ
ncbi:multidrug ABC transporter permease [Paenibacillus sp. J2TS4]|nr:multidrug ABC transporter permease [Paenibacillus sp. J2TS4]